MAASGKPIVLGSSARISGALRERKPPIGLPDCEVARRAESLRNRIHAYWDVRSQDDEAVITIYDEIGFFGVSATDVRRRLDEITASRIKVRINSPGGDVFDGIAIHNDLAQHPARVEVEVTGLAASAASIIAMAGDEVVMAENAFLMIHNAWGIVVGNRADMRSFADVLEEIDRALAGTYARRTGIATDEIARLMDAETWLAGAEAVERGFADRVAGGDDSQARALFDLSTFRNVPATLKRRLENGLRDAGYSKDVARSAAAEGFHKLEGRRDAGSSAGRRDAGAEPEELASVREIRDLLADFINT